MKRVVVNGRYTYETDLPVKINDIVEIPTADWLREVKGATWQGRVTALTSTYTGPCAEIIRIIKS